MLLRCVDDFGPDYLSTVFRQCNLPEISIEEQIWAYRECGESLGVRLALRLHLVKYSINNLSGSISKHQFFARIYLSSLFSRAYLNKVYRRFSS